ncbi:hypothetical protein JCM10213_000392 [Rhodosporidiobolus nylandii]
MAVKDIVEQKIQEGKPCVVFSKSYCPYCNATKKLLKDEGIDFDVYELDQIEDGSEWQNYLAQKTGQRTVPSIFIKQQHIGGNSDLQAKHKNGQLKALL